MLGGAGTPHVGAVLGTSRLSCGRNLCSLREKLCQGSVCVHFLDVCFEAPGGEGDKD